MANTTLGHAQTTQEAAGGKTSIGFFLYDGSGNIVSSFGGSSDVQYTEGDTDTTITGNAILWEDASNTLATVQRGAKALPVRHGGQGASASWWNAQHAPSANTKATITKASGGVGVRNICTHLTVALAAGSTAPAAVQVTVALIDGSTGGTTYLWGPTVLSLPATAGAVSAFVVGMCWKVGTANTAMTLEFSAAGGANTIESVSMDGTVITE